MITDEPLELRPAPAAACAWWAPGEAPRFGTEALREALRDVRRPLFVVQCDGRPGVTGEGQAILGGAQPAGALPLLAHAPALPPESLGDASFRKDHGLRYAYATGSMANAIASAELVESVARAGMVGFFGAAGLEPARVEEMVDRLQRSLPDLPYGFNLIHSPNEPLLEAEVANLYLRRGVRLVEASAFLGLTLPLLRYRLSGIHLRPDGTVGVPNRVVGKISRLEVARRFLSPAPEKLLADLVQEGTLTPEQARLAEGVPVAGDLTAEADSGGHTDNQSALALLPSILALRDEIQARFGYAEPPRVGAAGGIGAPLAAAAVLSMGADYVMTGSVNQACLEAGTSDTVREMLAKAGPADVTMAPAADMFEMGVQLQVLKWGTMFPVKARKLYDLYRSYPSLEALPAEVRTTLEKDYLRCTLAEAWASTRAFFEKRDPRQAARGEADPKHRMALVFRSYLGLSSRWANSGDPSRRADYQVWCGPAMGAFNEWVKGTYLENPGERRVDVVAGNLLLGACVLTRASWLRNQGLRLPPDAARFQPLEPRELSRLLQASLGARPETPASCRRCSQPPRAGVSSRPPSTTS